MAARQWTCRKCRTVHPRRKQLCPCGGRRPPARVPKHRAVLDAMPYEAWVERFGEVCGVCGRPPSVNRRLDRDHDHASGLPRGLACHRCNRTLAAWITPEWLEAAAAYLRRAEADSVER